MTNWVVSGALGFIGSHFLLQLQSRIPPGDNIIVLDKKTPAAMGGSRLEKLHIDRGHPNCFVFECDLTDVAAVEKICDAATPTNFIHFAAESHVDRSIDNPVEFVQSNVVGTQVLLSQAVRQHSLRPGDGVLFCQISTDEVYGPWNPDLGTGGYREDSPLFPRNPYAASKAAAEHLVTAAHETYGLATVITRGSNTYGPLQAPEKFLPMMIFLAAQGAGLPIYGDGQQKREWISVDDHVQGIFAAINSGESGEVYNIGSDQVYTNLEVAEQVIRLVGRGTILHVEDRPGHDRMYKIDSRKLQRLNWKPRADFFTAGIRDTVKWYLHPDNADWSCMNTSMLERRGLLR